MRSNLFQRAITLLITCVFSCVLYASVTSDNNHFVGELYQGGVVYYVNPDPNAPIGKRGLIAALQDIPGTKYCYSSNYSNDCSFFLQSSWWSWDDLLTNNQLFSGKENTEHILSQRPDEPLIAAAIAYNYFTNEDLTSHEWFLPSSDELRLLLSQNEKLTQSSGFVSMFIHNINKYWSSSTVKYYSGMEKRDMFMPMFSNNMLIDDGYANEHSVRVRPIKYF